MRRLHDSLLKHFEAIAALGEYHPPTGRIEALNNNWETIERRGRGYRDLASLMRFLRFMIVHPIRRSTDLERFLALGAVPTTGSRSCRINVFTDSHEEPLFFMAVSTTQHHARRKVDR